MITHLRHGRMWQIESNLSILENIRQGLKYFRETYRERYVEVRLKPFYREQIKAEMFQGLKLVADLTVPSGCIFFVREGDAPGEGDLLP